MNQQIIDYLKQNKDKYSKEDLIEQLGKNGYSEEEIKEGVSNIYDGVNNADIPAPPSSSTPQAPAPSVTSKSTKRVFKIIGIIVLVIGIIFAVIMASIMFVSTSSTRKGASKAVIGALAISANSKASLCADAGHNINKPVAGKLICDGLNDKWPELDKPGRWGELIDGDVSDKTFEYTLYIGDEKITCTEIACNLHSDTVEHRDASSQKNKSVPIKEKTKLNNNDRIQVDENSSVIIGDNEYGKKEDNSRTEEVKSYCNLKNSIKFGDKIFKLAWSNEVVTGDYLLEYVPAGENVEHYRNMLSIECVENEQITVDDAVAVFVNNLEKEKQKDDFVHYEVYAHEETGAKMVDSLLRDEDAIEWNIYKYQFLKQFTGTKGVIRFGFSKRVYGDEQMDFMKKLSQIRKEYINIMTAIDLKQIFE